MLRGGVLVLGEQPGEAVGNRNSESRLQTGQRAALAVSVWLPKGFAFGYKK